LAIRRHRAKDLLGFVAGLDLGKELPQSLIGVRLNKYGVEEQPSVAVDFAGFDLGSLAVARIPDLGSTVSGRRSS